VGGCGPLLCGGAACTLQPTSIAIHSARLTCIIIVGIITISIIIIIIVLVVVIVLSHTASTGQWLYGCRTAQDEGAGIKGVMGLLLQRALPALENHYIVFAGEEVNSALAGGKDA
jgi:hypothetical protein